jgi:exopolyphosphatase/guanosine-5'-triphosphate,3'-diphosphate pyrophosphatase
MKTARRAVIDVGTNSIKLLVAEVQGSTVRPIWEQSKQTRLGQGFYPEHRLQPGPIAHTAKAIAEFAAKAAELGAGEPRVVATSAAREAINQIELSTRVREACGLTIRVITGEEEARYAFVGVNSDPELPTEPRLLLDVGGGSTELILGLHTQMHFAHSFPLGTVRLLDVLRPDDPPAPDQLTACRAWLAKFLQREVSSKLIPALNQVTGPGLLLGNVQLIGTGGTASILGCMEAKLTTFDRKRLEETRLSRDRVRWHVQNLWGMPTTDREKIVGLPPNRADVILTGAAIYEAIMDCFDFEQLQISTRGLRFAIVLEDV